VPSASRYSARLAVLAACGLLLTGALGACSTTQEKAERRQAESRRILDARAEHQSKKHADGPKSRTGSDKSAHRPQEEEQ
jgi:hypothetical protein